MKIKISKTWIIILIIIAAIAGYYVLKPLFKSPIEGLIIQQAQKGEVLQEISETGSISATENLGLGFKTIGKVLKINVAVGDNVRRGDILAQLDASQISAQLQSAKAALNYAINQHDSGVALAKDDLESAYKQALNTLSEAYNKIYNAYNEVSSLQRTYFGPTDQEGIKVSDSRNDISDSMDDVKKYLDTAESAATNTNIDSAISQMLIALDNVYNSLKIVREQCELSVYKFNVSSADKASLDTQKANINTAISSVTSAQNNISSYKIALSKAEERAINLENGEGFSSSQIEEARANIDALQSQLNDNYLVSPINGKITEVNIKRGQVISASQTAVRLLSSDPFEIKVNIYEQDIVSVEPGQNVKIELVAFPKETFYGKVLSIDPAETIVDSVVYYQVTIGFPNQPEQIKSGMTADIIIETNQKSDVLRVPKSAVSRIRGEETVQIVINQNIETRVIITGLEGNDYYEVISGLQEGDTIIIGKK